MSKAHEKQLTGSSLAAAALLACGIGCASLGVVVSASEAIPALKDLLNLYPPVGPLSGKTIYAVAAWLLSWALLAHRFKGRHVDLSRVTIYTYVLVVVGLLGTFPPIYGLLAALGASL